LCRLPSDSYLARVSRLTPWPTAAILATVSAVILGCGGGGGGQQQAAGTSTSNTNTSAQQKAAAKKREREQAAAKKGNHGTSSNTGGASAKGQKSEQQKPGHKKSGSKESGGKTSGGKNNSSGPSAPGGTSAPQQGSGTPAPGHATVTIQGFAFKSSHVTIRVGGYVYWVNKDHTEHTATSKSGPTPPKGKYRPPASPYIGRDGGTYTDFFRQRGTYYYICTIHPRMHGYITVK
jgi:plastocyanin